MYNVRIVIRVLEPAAGHHLLCGRFQENLENQENPKKDYNWCQNSVKRAEKRERRGFEFGFCS